MTLDKTTKTYSMNVYFNVYMNVYKYNLTRVQIFVHESLVEIP